MTILTWFSSNLFLHFQYLYDLQHINIVKWKVLLLVALLLGSDWRFKCLSNTLWYVMSRHDNIIKWKHFRRYFPLGRGIHRSPVVAPQRPHKGQWRGALMFSLIYVRMNKRLSTHSERRWLAMPSRSLWSHCNVFNKSHRDILSTDLLYTYHFFVDIKGTK